MAMQTKPFSRAQIKPTWASMLAVAAVASAAVRVVQWQVVKQAAMRLSDAQSGGQNLDAALCLWDCLHYELLAKNLVPHAFFPLFPWLSSVVASLTNLSSLHAVLRTSQFVTVLADISILFLGEALWPSRKVGQPQFAFGWRSWALFLLCAFFPHGHAWLRGYPESVFVLFFATGLICLTQQKWYSAGLLLGMTAVTRPQGIWLVGFFVLLVGFRRLMAMRGQGSPWNPTWRESVGAACLSALPFLCLLGWQAVRAGHPLYFLHKQKEGWGRVVNVWGGILANLPLSSYSAFPMPEFEGSRLWQSHVFVALSLIATVVFMRRWKSLPWLYLGVVTLAMAEVPLFFGGFYSVPRFMSTNLGMFCLLIELGSLFPPLLACWFAWSFLELSRLFPILSSGGWIG